MHFFRRRAHGVTASVSLIAFLILTGCGDVYRPVAIPITSPGGDPQTTHLAVVLSKGNLAANPPENGKAAVFDVSGDSNMGNYPTGLNPVAAKSVIVSTIFGLKVRTFVVNQGT